MQDETSDLLSPRSPRSPSFESSEDTVISVDFDGCSFSEKDRFINPTIVASRVSRVSSYLSVLLTWSTLLTACRLFLIALLPSYIQNRLSHQPATQATNRKSTNITTLDGLRGLACLFVFNEHYTYNYTITFLIGYGVTERRTLIQWPFLRIPWSGGAMVAVFYVISGYVLSAKPLRQIRSKDLTNFQTAMTSSVLRRAFRIYLPPIIAIFITAVLIKLGAFRAATVVWETNQNYLHLHEIPPAELPTLSAQFYDALKASVAFLNVWEWDYDIVASGDYDRHTWTIPVEFRCSMALFLMLIAIARLRQAFRITCICVFIIYCIAVDRKDVILFISGLLLAELDLIRKETEDYTKYLPRWTNHVHQPARNLRFPIWPLLFIIGLYFASAPMAGCDATPGFITLYNLVPDTIKDKAFFLRSIGAVLIVWATANSDFLAPLFTNSFTRYLGQISFALYLVHGNVLKSVQYATLPWIYSVTGALEPDAPMEVFVGAWALGLLWIVPITFWAADLFWRAVDLPCVKFARWVEEAISHKDGSSKEGAEGSSRVG